MVEDQTVTDCQLLYNFDGSASFNNGTCVIQLNQYGRFELKIILQAKWGEIPYIINGYSVDDDFFDALGK